MTYGNNARMVVPGRTRFQQVALYDDPEDEDTLPASERLALFDRLTNFNRHYNSGCTNRDIQAFAADWKLLLRTDFTTEETGRIMQVVSEALIKADWNDPDLYRGCRREIVENWAQWEGNVLPSMARARAADVIQVYMGCADLRIKPSKDFSGFVHTLVGQKASLLKPPHFRRYLVAAAVLKDTPPAHVVTKVYHSLTKFFQDLGDTACSLLWASAVLHSLTGDNQYKKLAEKIKIPDVGGMPKSWQKMIYDAYTWLDGNPLHPIRSERIL